MNLDMLAFASLSETAMRLHSREQFETAYRERLVAHDDGKEFQRHMKRLQKTSGSKGADGDNLIADLGASGAMK